MPAAQSAQIAYYDRQTNAEQFSVGDRVLVYDPVSRGFSKFQKHFVGPYEVAAKPIAGGVTYILRACDTGTIIHVHRNRHKKCQVLFPELQTVDVLIDSVAPDLADVGVDRQESPHALVAEPQAPPVAGANAVEAPPLGAVNPQPGDTRDQPAREPVEGRPRRAVHQPERLADSYTQAFAWKPRKKD